MIEQRLGKIINTASVSSALGHPNAVSYAAAKHGVVGMMKVLANEWAHYNVNAIGPGVVRTPMTEGAFQNREKLRDLEAKVPMGRLGDTGDLVGAAVFLASRASDYITGHHTTDPRQTMMVKIMADTGRLYTVVPPFWINRSSPCRIPLPIITRAIFAVLLNEFDGNRILGGDECA